MNVALIWIFPVDLNFASVRVAYICMYALCNAVAIMHNLHIFVKYNSLEPRTQKEVSYIFLPFYLYTEIASSCKMKD